MERLLVISALFLSLTNLTLSDFVVPGIRNIQKRSPQDPSDDIEIYSVNIQSQITSRFAHNVITSRAVNRADSSREVSFDVDLPKTAFITNFTMVIDGVTYPGVIKEKEAAKKQYEKAVSRGQSAGLVRASGRKTEKFTVSVNVASQSKVTFELIYEELLKRSLGKYEMFIKVRPKKLVQSFKIEVNINEPQGISFLEAQGTFMTNDLLPLIHKSFSGEKGHVSFKPTFDQQRSCSNCSTTQLDGDFTVTYDVNRETPGNIQVVNGYFVHFFAPSKLKGVPKNVVFIIDRSGSMYGVKLKQTKEALLKILGDMKEHDHFNFILFDSRVDVWKESLVKATPDNLKQAKEFVSRIKDDGMTNINDAVLRAVPLLDNAHESGAVPRRSVSLIILLTDGEANVGESNPTKIQENARNAIKGKYSLYSLGFGTGVDYTFLEKLALENSGVARRIYEDSDAALQLEGFYDEVANPTLMDIELQYPENSISDVTKNKFKHYFDGSEIVVAGRITDNDLNWLTADVTAEGETDTLKYSENIKVQEEPDAEKQQQYIFGDFTERLWAYLTIQQLLEKRISAPASEKENLTAQALEMSLKYQFVTPLTSMVVTKPEEKAGEEEAMIADKFVEGQSYSAPTHTAFGSQAYLYQAPPNVYSVDSDPHFIIQVPEKKDALCFNIQETPGVVLNIVSDPELGIAVNGELIGNKKSGNVTSNETYFGKMGIVSTKLDLRIEVTTEGVTVVIGAKKMALSWQQDVTVTEEGFSLLLNKKKNLLLSMGDGARFIILLHKVWRNHPLHRDFLGFYTLDSQKFSERVHGLLGQFYHGVDYDISNIHKTDNPEKPDATMRVKHSLITVTRGSQKDYRKDLQSGSKVQCWFVHNNGEGLIDGVHTDYIVPDLFSGVYKV
ncbi:inter-alpha-trypsin inhibitor heavy chain H3 isoform X2 [Xenopus laevis]|uniref:Inter-alpha-trypsin inhibitor heavy chain H3 n=1 Tax=Xenopus laevis TaxID=8355 RepID=A0A8J1MYK0_XENLA|nr:inter-alpha-trypsin inhibitor heavy chain H3 isoform X2 [Xenopus laevis]